MRDSVVHGILSIPIDLHQLVMDRLSPRAASALCGRTVLYSRRHRYQDLGFHEGVADLAVQQFIPQLAVEGFDVPFSHGLPGSMNNVWTSRASSHRHECRREFRSVVDRMCAGTPYVINSAASVSSTSIDRIRRYNDRQALPRADGRSSVGGRRARSATKSYAQHGDTREATRQPATTGLVSAVSAAL